MTTYFMQNDIEINKFRVLPWVYPFKSWRGLLSVNTYPHVSIGKTCTGPELEAIKSKTKNIVPILRRLDNYGNIYVSGGVLMNVLSCPQELELVKILILAIRSFGVRNIQFTGNDLLVNGRKICGMAARPGFHEASLLVTGNLEEFDLYLPPKNGKISSDRISFLSDFIPGLTVGDMQQAILEEYLKNSPATPISIEEIMNTQDWRQEEQRQINQIWIETGNLRRYRNEL